MDDKSLETRTLRYFVTVVECLHISKAADRLGISQSALSVIIQRLEQRLGVRLLSRNKRQPMSLTDAGKIFHAHAVVALKHIDRADQVGRLAARGLVGTIKMGYVGSAVTTGILQNMLGMYRKEHPAVNVEILHMETPIQVRGLVDGLIDIGLFRSRRTYPEGIDSVVVSSERLVIMLSSDHALCSKKHIALEDLCNETFIIPQFKESEGFAEVLNELESLGGFERKPEHRVKDFMSALVLAAASYGVVLAPESARAMAPPGIESRAISDFDRSVSLVLAFRSRANSPAVSALIEQATLQYRNACSDTLNKQ